MAAIKLTDRHIVMMITMSNRLLTDYKGGVFIDVPQDLCKNHAFIIAFIDEQNDYKPNCDLYMHWFEFCSTMLLYKLSYALFKNNIKASSRNKNDNKEVNLFSEYHLVVNDYAIKRTSLHPVEYLYSQYEKLNSL